MLEVEDCAKSFRPILPSRRQREAQASTISSAKQNLSLVADIQKSEAGPGKLLRAIPFVRDIDSLPLQEGLTHTRLIRDREMGHALQVRQPCSFDLRRATTFDACNQLVPPNSPAQSRQAVQLDFQSGSAQLEALPGE